MKSRTTWLYSCVPAGDRGGVQAVVRRVAEAVGASGRPVTTYWAHPLSDTAAGPAERSLPLATGSGRPVRDVLAALRSLLRLGVSLARERPRVVNVHFPMGQSAYFLLLRRVFGYRLVLSLHGSDLLHPSGPVRHVLGILLRAADAVVVVSDTLRRVAVERYRVDPTRVHLIANGIDADFWTPAPGSPRADEPSPGAGASFRLLGVGRLVDVKGFDLLIDALARLVPLRAGLTLEIVGEGEARGALERRVIRAGLDGRVSLPGHLEGEALRVRMRAATLFVLPSRSEGLPLALLEAMACGTAVIACDVGGVREVLGGLPDEVLRDCIVPPEDVHALAEAIDRALIDPERLGQRAEFGRRIAASHRIEGVDDAYRKLFAGMTAPASERVCS